MKIKISKLGFMLSSLYRTTLLKIMDGRIFVGTALWKKAQKELPKIDRSKYHKCLRDMVRTGVLECVNPEERQGRAYKLTPLGARLRKIITQKIGGEQDVSSNLR